MESITNNEFLNSVLESEAWKEVSSRESFSMEMIEKFADKVNWGEIITNWNIEKPVEFFARFQQYIPMSKLQDSSLWRAWWRPALKRLCKKQSVSINAIGLSLWKLMSNSQTIRINGREVLRELPDFLCPIAANPYVTAWRCDALMH